MKPTHLFINIINFRFLVSEKAVQLLVVWCLALTLFLIYSHPAKAQTNENPLTLRSVLLAEPRIAGNFGEFRGNHFHSGIDYKTNETEGWPVLSAGDGYVSRVKVSSVGYGKAIYITHPNGIVTVYGHLRAFYPALTDTISALQTQKQQFEVEIFPDSSLFKVTQGQLIGFSGNSGGTEGPHLHFETRHQESEKPFNPQLAGFPVSDTIPPIIKALVVYTPGPLNGLQGATRQIFECDTTKNSSFLQPIMVENSFFIGFEGYDLAGNEPNHLGFRTYRVLDVDSVLFECSIDSFSFDETRQINSLIDYGFQQESNRKITLCYVLPGNSLSFFAKGNGLFSVKNKRSKSLKLEVEDYAGNKTRVDFLIAGKSTGKREMSALPGKLITYGKPLELNGEDYKLNISKKSFFEDVSLELTSIKSIDPLVHSTSLIVSPATLPLFEPMEIALKIDSIPPAFTSKLIMVKVDSLGVFSAVGGKFSDGWLKAKTRSLGKFAVTLDTIAPIIMDPVFKPDDFTGFLKLQIAFKPDLSGIKTYQCFINDQWICGEYNAGRNEIDIFFSTPPAPGTPFKLRLEVSDGCENKSNFEKTILYGQP